jgi:hypothetical protein
MEAAQRISGLRIHRSAEAKRADLLRFYLGVQSIETACP